MSAHVTPKRTHRAPNGCSAQVCISFSPAERERLLALAQREHRSASATARLLIQRGMDSLAADRESGGPASLAS